MNWYITVIKKYAEFEGRARRSEYWYFTLFNFIIYMVPYGILISMMVVDPESIGTTGGQILSSVVGLYGLFSLLPSFAVSVRRLHDTGRSGWNLLWGVVPLIGGIILLIYFFSDSQPGTNEYGPNPKDEGQEFELYEN